MTLAVAFKGPEGIALAADSRVTLTTVHPSGTQLSSYFDNATKLLSIQGQPFVGVVTYGMGALGQTEPRTAHSYLPEFEAHLAGCHSARAKVADIAQEVGTFYLDQWNQAGMPVGDPNTPSMFFLVAGFDDGEAYGRVYEVDVPNAPTPLERNPGGEFGLTFGGQHELVSRLLNGVDPQAAAVAQTHLGLDDTQLKGLLADWGANLGLPIPYQFLPLQDCVDLSTFLVTMTSAVQTWTVGVRGVGGAVDVATITRTEGFRGVKQKRIEVRDA
jgi:hypothetical protein